MLNSLSVNHTYLQMLYRMHVLFGYVLYTDSVADVYLFLLC